jgi:hypothetical protein
LRAAGFGQELLLPWNGNSLPSYGSAAPRTELDQRVLQVATSAGAKLLENYPVGPLAGVAFNMTLMSYMGSLDVGINIDEAAVESPDLLRESLQQAFGELSSYAPPREATTSGPASELGSPTKRRWWQRSR